MRSTRKTAVCRRQPQRRVREMPANVQRMTRIVCFSVAAAVACTAPTPRAQQTSAQAEPVLRPTPHPRLPADIGQLWLAPDPSHTHTALMAQFTQAVKLEVDSNYAQALPILTQPAMQEGP